MPSSVSLHKIYLERQAPGWKPPGEGWLLLGPNCHLDTAAPFRVVLLCNLEGTARCGSWKRQELLPMTTNDFSIVRGCSFSNGRSWGL